MLVKGNREFLNKAFKCNEEVMRYLVYGCKLTILHYEIDEYYFLDTPELREFLNKAPFILKLKNNFFIGR